MTRRRPGAGGDGREAPLRLLPPVLVPLSAEQERRAVDALAGLLAGLLAHRGGSDGLSGGTTGSQHGDVPDDDETA